MPDQTRNLNSVTDFAGTLDANDRIIMTDNKASLKALTTVILGKAMIEGYTGSSLAGSNQSVKAAIDGLNSNIIPKHGWNVAGGRCSDYTNVGFYYMGNASDAPKVGAAVLVNSGIPERLIQTYIINDGSIYTRWYDGNTFSQWIPQPTRTEVDTLNSKQTFNITTSTGTWPSEVTLHSASYAYRFNNIVTVHLNLKIVSSTKKSFVIANILPESMWPKYDVMAAAGDGDADGVCQPFTIRADGGIGFWNTKTGTTYVQGDITYIAKSGVQ